MKELPSYLKITVRNGGDLVLQETRILMRNKRGDVALRDPNTGVFYDTTGATIQVDRREWSPVDDPASA